MVANPQRNDWHGNMNPQHDDAYENSMKDMHGTPMTEEAFEKLISVELPYHYELIDGVVYNMTGSSPRHSVLASRVDKLLSEQIGTSGPCRVHREQFVFIPGKPSVVPDAVLTCDLADWDEDTHLRPFKIRSPLIVVEVLSPSTEQFDRTEKFARYKLCPTLEVYILVNQYEPHIEVYQRSRDWQPELYVADQIVQFDHLDLELPLDALYEGVL
jgi:Uma2 family endonuclease